MCKGGEGMEFYQEKQPTEVTPQALTHPLCGLVKSIVGCNPPSQSKGCDCICIS